MRQFFTFLSYFFFLSSGAQNPTYQQKLYYTCKVWGFVKYYHSEVSTCQVNWDSILVANLPLVKNAITKDDFNDALDTMLNAAGPMQIAVSYLPDTIQPELKLNRDWGWISDTMLRSDVQVLLDTIRNNFRPHPECWVQDNQYTNSYSGWLVLPFDSLMINQNLGSSFPDEWHRLLLMFKYWNVLRYFNPYNYVLTTSWDTTLYYEGIQFANATNYSDLFLHFRETVANLNDAHAEGLSYSSVEQFPMGYYGVYLKLKWIPGKYIVVKSQLNSISLGDEIVSVNGLTTTQWEDSLRPFISAGDSSVFRRFMSQYLLSGPANSSVTIVSKDSLGNSHTLVHTRNAYLYNNWFTSYYPNDTLATASYKLWNCNVGYVNMGRLQQAEVSNMYNDLQNTSAIIFDLRNYPNATAWSIADYLYPQRISFAKAMIPDVTYPGTYYWYIDSLGTSANSTPYQGKVIVLMNEETQSQAEYSCMILSQMPDVAKVGSQTAGADGNITYFQLSQDLHAGFTSIGIFYPNGDSTQRIGIVPDSISYPTQAGLLHHRDEVLEKALEIAQCGTSVSEQAIAPYSFNTFPNPASNTLNIHMSGLDGNKVTISIMDVTGRLVAVRESEFTNKLLDATLDISNLCPGVYYIQVISDEFISSAKVVKE